MTHLTDRSIRGLLDGTLPRGEARGLADHLQRGCEVCEELLAARSGADAADGWVDAALSAAAGRPEVSGNDVEFARIERRLARGERGRSRLPLAVAAAAAVLLAGAAGLLVARAPSERSGWDGVKGTAPVAGPVRLRYLVLAPSPGGEPAIEKGVEGRPVSAAASLQFEIETGRAAEVAVLRVPARGPVDLFFQGRVGPGRTLLTVGGRPAAYPLLGALGAQRFVLLAGDEGLSPDRIARAASGLAPPARVSPDAPGLEGLSVDVVDMEVR